MSLEPLDHEVTDRLVGYREAVFNQARTHRYYLADQPGHPNGLAMVFLMLNPSTATHLVNDPTITRCAGFARRAAAGAWAVVNLFAYRATDPAELLDQLDRVGPRNDDFIIDTCAKGQLPGWPDVRVAVIAAWGAQVDKPELAPRARFVEGLLDGLGVPLWCLGRTSSGEPRHPLMVPACTRFEAYNDHAEHSLAAKGAAGRKPALTVA